MEDDKRERRRKIADDIENLVDDVNEVVRVVVKRGSNAAGSVGETIRETIEGVRSSRDNAVMVRVSKESLARLDELVEAGIAGSRSEASAFLIGEGIKARQGLFDGIADKIGEIRKTREELQKLLDEEENIETDSSTSASS